MQIEILLDVCRNHVVSNQQEACRGGATIQGLARDSMRGVLEQARRSELTDGLSQKRKQMPSYRACSA